MPILSNRKLNIGALAVILLSIGIVVSVSLLRPKKPKRIPEAFPITGVYQAYFELQPDKTIGVLDGEDVNIDVYLTTNGEEFDIGVATIEWDPADFRYKDSQEGDLPGDEDFLSTYAGGVTYKRSLGLYVPTVTPPLVNMTTTGPPDYTPAKFFTLTLTAERNNPTSEVKILTLNDGLLVHFVNSGVDNSLDQSLTDVNNTKVKFYLCTPGEKQCTGNILQTCNADGNGWTDQNCGSSAYCNPSSLVCQNYQCTGTTPSNAAICSGDNTNLTQNTAKTAVDSCTAAKCEWLCDDYYHKNASSTNCGVNQCSGTVPTNSSLCTGDNTNIPGRSNVTRKLVASCSTGAATAANKCEYTCSSGYTKVGSSCQQVICTPNTEKQCTGNILQTCNADGTGWTDQNCGSSAYCNPSSLVCQNYQCTGTTPSNAAICSGDNTNLTQNTAKTAVDSCTAAKCEWQCSSGYTKVGSSCLPPACQYDYDDSQSIDVGDLLYVLRNWGSTGITPLLQILRNWGESC